MSKILPNKLKYTREIEFCRSQQLLTNEHGVYIYVSQNGALKVNLLDLLYFYALDVEEDTKNLLRSLKDEPAPDFDLSTLNNQMKYDWLVENFETINLDQLKTLLP